MSGPGDTLRAARERRGESRAECAAAAGITDRVAAAIEDGDLASLGAPAQAAAAVRGYAAHLGLDADGLAERAWAAVAGDEDDTRPLAAPVPAPPRPRGDSALTWIAAGAGAGVVALVALGVGLSPSGDAPARTPAPGPTTTADRAPQTPQAPPTTLRPAPAAAREPLDLIVGARPGTTVWVEARRRGPRGPALFAGIVGEGVTRRFRVPGPVWLGVAWAPNVVVRVDGRRVDTPGGTESYVVTAAGARRLVAGSGP